MFITKYRNLLRKYKLKHHICRVYCFIDNCSEDSSCRGLLGGDSLSDYVSYSCINCKYFTPILRTEIVKGCERL